MYGHILLRLRGREGWFPKGNLGRSEWILCRKKKKSGPHATFLKTTVGEIRARLPYPLPLKIKNGEFRDEDSRRTLTNHKDW